MTTAVPLEAVASFVEGAVDVNRAPGWFAPWRLPYADRHLHHPMLLAIAACPAGVRLRFRTESDTVTLATEHRVAPDFDLPFTPVYDVCVDGEPLASSESPSFTGLGAHSKVVEVWLPLVPGVRVTALSLDDGATAQREPDDRDRWITYGSSITHCLEAVRPTATWPAVAARALDRHLTCLGYAGQAHFDPLVARVIAGLPADHISLKVGINVHNGQSLRERTFAPMLHGFIANVRDGHPDTPITVISPIISPEREHSTATLRTMPDGTELLMVGDLTLAAMRDIVAAVVERRRARGDHALRYLDGRELFGEADLDHLPDGLHPDAEGYARMGARFAALHS